MIVVTGGAGFIGSNIVKGLNDLGRKDILVVDDLTDGTKFSNLADLDIADYMDKDKFISEIISGENLDIEVFFHQGACSSTTEWNGKFMMENNYNYSKDLLHYCLDFDIPFPDHLKGRYQSFTQADLTKFRKTGCSIEFKTVAQGTTEYMKWLNEQ